MPFTSKFLKGKWDIFEISRNLFLRKSNAYGYKSQTKISYSSLAQPNNREVNPSVASSNHMLDVKQELTCRSVALQKIWFDMPQSYNALHTKETSQIAAH